jgi:hypothetical protein
MNFFNILKNCFILALIISTIFYSIAFFELFDLTELSNFITASIYSTNNATKIEKEKFLFCMILTAEKYLHTKVRLTDYLIF